MRPTQEGDPVPRVIDGDIDMLEADVITPERRRIIRGGPERSARSRKVSISSWGGDFAEDTQESGALVRGPLRGHRTHTPALPGLEPRTLRLKPSRLNTTQALREIHPMHKTSPRFETVGSRLHFPRSTNLRPNRTSSMSSRSGPQTARSAIEWPPLANLPVIGRSVRLPAEDCLKNGLVSNERIMPRLGACTPMSATAPLKHFHEGRVSPSQHLRICGAGLGEQPQTARPYWHQPQDNDDEDGTRTFLRTMAALTDNAQAHRQADTHFGLPIDPAVRPPGGGTAKDSWEHSSSQRVERHLNKLVKHWSNSPMSDPINVKDRRSLFWQTKTLGGLLHFMDSANLQDGDILQGALQIELLSKRLCKELGSDIKAIKALGRIDDINHCGTR